MRFLLSMGWHVGFLNDDGALKAQVICIDRGSRSRTSQGFADLSDERDIIVYGAQSGLVMLNAVVCGLLVMVHKTLHMFCMLC